MNSPMQQQRNQSNNPIEQVEGRGAGNVDVPIILSNNSNEFQAFMQELKSHRAIMTTFMEEIKQQSQYNLENLKKWDNQAKKLLLKDNSLMNSRGSILITYEKLVSFTAYLCRQRLDTFLPT